MSSIPSKRSSSAAKNNYNVLPDGEYEARLVRFIGLGMQDQPEWEGQKKDPAFKCSVQFELIGVDATGTDSEGKPLEPRPACQFKDYFLFPGAKRGNVFDLCQILDPTVDKVPGKLEWFIDQLGGVVNLTVGHYVTKAGDKRNKIVKVGSVPAKYKGGVGPARCELVGFDPYEDSDTMFAAYSKLFKFQHQVLEEAHDSDNIPFAGKEPAKLNQEGEDTKPQTQTAAKVADEDDRPF